MNEQTYRNYENVNENKKRYRSEKISLYNLYNYAINKYCKFINKIHFGNY